MQEKLFKKPVSKVKKQLMATLLTYAIYYLQLCIPLRSYSTL